MEKNRYPGLRSFEEEDDKLFFGREKESAQLASIIYSERFVVLFGSSGVGKSSLLNTLYRKQKDLLSSFHPIRIRIQANQETEDGKDVSPFEIVKNELTSFFAKRSIVLDPKDILFDKKNPGLWEWVKLAEMVQAKNNLGVIFVLVFDQFEEYFSLPVEIQNNFSAQLSEILHEQSPARTLDWMATINDKNRTPDDFQWYNQITSKVVFSIRSDKLYYIGGLVNFIPSILRSRMELKHFDEDNAKEAIEEPAKLEGPFMSPKINYLGNITDKITQAVINNAGEVDSTLLQIICYTVEQVIISKDLDPNITYGLTEEEFDTKISLDQILDSFYMGQTAKFNDPATIELIRTAIEYNLVERGERIALSEQQLISRLNNRIELIPELIKHRLIREEQTAGKSTKYELIHDKLIPIVQRRKDLRDKEKNIKLELEQEMRERGRRTRRFYRIMVSLIMAALIVIFYVKASIAKKDSYIEQAQNAFTSNNQFLAYNCMDRLQRDFYVAKLDEHKQAINLFNKKFLYDISGGDKIEVIDEFTFAVYNNSEQSIYIWKADDESFAGKGKLKLRRVFYGALNMVVSKVGQYVAFRNTEGYAIVYNINRNKAETIEHSMVKLVSIGDNFNSDYNMTFLEDSPCLVYINEDLQYRFYNAATKKLLMSPSLKISKEYNSDALKKTFYYSPGSNYYASKKINNDTVKFWFIDNTIYRIDLVTNVRQVFTTSRTGEFAYWTNDGKVYSRTFGPGNNSQKLITENIIKIIPFNDQSKFILIGKKGLRVYDFRIDDYDKNFDKSKKLFERLQKNYNPIDSRPIVCSKNGRLLIQELVVVDLDEIKSSALFAKGDYPPVYDTKSNNCITSDVKGRMRLAYINQYGCLVLKKVGNDAIEKEWQIVNQVETLSSYSLEQLCRFSDSGRYFAFISPEKEKKRLTIVDLDTGKEEVQNLPVKIIGDYFSDKYIHILKAFGTSGGLFFLNHKKRNSNYYKTIFPTMTEENKKTINFK